MSRSTSRPQPADETQAATYPRLWRPAEGNFSEEPPQGLAARPETPARVPGLKALHELIQEARSAERAAEGQWPERWDGLS